MYQSWMTGENVYSLAEAAFIMGIPIEELNRLIKAKSIGHSMTQYGYVVTHTDIAHYLAYGQGKKKRSRRKRRGK